MIKKLLFFILFISSFAAQAQLNVFNNTNTPSWLVQNILMGNGVTATNITFNGSAANANAVRDQVGYFTTGTAPTNLGIDTGIILATGNAMAAIGPNGVNNLSMPTGNPVQGDADLSTLILPATNLIRNKAALEFDFIPTGNTVSFRFVFASEEYPEYVNSAFNDAFGFFLTGPGISGPYTGSAANIALIPSTITAIAINNVNGGFAAGCPTTLPGGSFSQYYVNNCGGSTIQYDGFTTVLTANATVQCGAVYHIKLVIANVGDNGWDSAVFLQANSFSSTPINLGADMLQGAGTAICSGDTRTLNTGLASTVPHQWYFNNSPILGATNPTLVVTNSGLYKIIAFPYGALCPIEDEIDIEFYPPLPVNPPTNLYRCLGNNIYNLLENDLIVLGTLGSSGYEINYSTSIADGQNGIFIPNPSTYTSTLTTVTIYAVSVNINSGSDCMSIQPFQLVHMSCTLNPQPPANIVVCDDISNDGLEIFNLTVGNIPALNGLNPLFYSVSYHTSQAFADAGTPFITTPNAYNSSTRTIYIRVQEIANITNYATTSFNITVNPLPTVVVNSPTVCSGMSATVTATPGTSGSYSYMWTVPTGVINPGSVSTFSTTIAGVYSVVITNTVTGCISLISSGTVAINSLPTVVVNSPTVCSGATATITATPGTAGSYSYVWTVPVGVINPGNVSTFTTTIAGVYSVIITNTVTGCVSVSSIGTVILNANPTVVVNSPTVCSGATATITATPGTAGSYNYVWTVPTGFTNPGNASTFTTTIGGIYSVVITNTVTGCISLISSGTVTINSLPTVVVNSPTVCFGATATITATPGTAGSYSYAWTVPTGVTNPGSVASFSTIIAGVYSVIITNTVTNCVSVSSIGTVSLNTNPTVVVNSPTVCSGATATITATPGTAGSYNYVWTVPTGVTTPGNVSTFTTTIAGSYSVIITNTITGCVSVSSIGTVTINPLPTVVVNSPTVCSGATATITATPGTAGSYNYVWTVPTGVTTPGNVSTFTTTIGGIYSVVITNTVTGCISLISSGTVTINSLPTVVVNNPTVCFGATATVTATPGTTGSYNYVWTVPTGATNPGSVSTFSTTIAGVYSVVITNTVTGCISLISSGTVAINSLPTVVVNSPTVCSGATATITATPGTAGSYNYVWTVPVGVINPGNVSTFTATNAGVYSVIITDTTTSCSSVSAIGTVTVLPLPTATISGSTNVCPTGSATISFTGTPNATVQYTINSGLPQNLLLDATGTAVLTTTYTTTTVYNLVGVSSVTTPICTATLAQTATVTVSPAPTINNPTTPLAICDDNNDGFGLFNLTQLANFITAGNASLQITYHETLTNAQQGSSAIPNPSNYESINPWTQTIYVRVINPGAAACPSITTFMLQVNPFPIIDSTPDAYPLCDDNTDGLVVFDLTTRITDILEGLNPSLHTVTFYTSQANAIAATSPITTAYNSATATLWVRVYVNATGCFSVVALNVVVNPLPTATLPWPLSLCDYNNSGDEQEPFDLTLAIPQIVGTQTGMVVSYYLTLAQAQAGNSTNALPNTYTNISNGQTIYVRVTNSTTGCYSTTTLDLLVNPLPTPIAPLNAVFECDDNTDGLANFDLSVLVPSILAGATNVAITFYESLANAEAGSNSINTSVLYQNTVPGQQFLYIRAQNTITGCYRVVMMELRVIPSPLIPVLNNLSKCDTNGNPQDGLETFDLTVQSPLIQAMHVGPIADYQIRYFTSQASALTNAGAIITAANFQNTVNPQTIWVRVTHLPTGCFSVSSFDLRVNVPLALNFPTPLTLCDESLPNDQFTEFNLTVKNSEITQGLSGYTVAYYPSYANALSNTSIITNPTTYINTIATSQTLGVKVTSTEGCISFTTLTIRVIPLPTPRFDPVAIEVCDNTNPGDGVEAFDLTVRDAYIRNSDLTTTLTYHETQQDAENGVNAIAIPTAYVNSVADFHTIWVRVTNNPTNPLELRCYRVMELDLIVNPIPEVFESPIFTQCQPFGVTTASFDLTTMTPRILGANQSQADYTVTYHLTVSGASGVVAADLISNNYTNISNPQTVYVRVVNNTTGCFNAIATVTLLVEEGTTANPVPVNSAATTQCDVDGINNGISGFNLTTNVTPIVLGANNPLGALVYYYTSLTAAQTAVNSQVFVGNITNPTSFVNTIPLSQTIYAVVTNPATTTGCSSILPIVLTVNRLPEPTPEKGTVCVNPVTGVLVSSYTIESNLAATTHTFVWTNSTATVLGTAENLTVTTPGMYTVTATNTATGCVSLPVTVQVIQSQQAIISAVVTNAFTSSQIITVTATGTTVPSQNNTNYVYQLDFGPMQVSNVFTDVSVGWHTVTVIDLNGCEEATLNIFVIDYPKFFTPNGDGINDDWNINTLSYQPNSKIYIFDRYGKLIKEIRPSGPGWNGTFNGNPLPATDYWFVVFYEEDTVSKEFKAHFSLKR